MKVKLLAVFILCFSVPAAALDLDITNHPHKDFLLGYKRSYPVDCDVVWWASQWETEHIISLGGCEGISDARMVNDMNNFMDHLKNTTRYRNFSEYFRAVEANDHKSASKSPYGASPSPGYPVQFCIDGARGRYFFSGINTSFKPGWKSIYLLHDSDRKLDERVGYWQVSSEGTVIAISDARPLVIYESDETKPCGYV